MCCEAPLRLCVHFIRQDDLFIEFSRYRTYMETTGTVTSLPLKIGGINAISQSVT